jgi:hypothetical protein
LIKKEIKSGSWYLDLIIRNTKQQIILSQIMPIDTKRLAESLGEINEDEIKKIVVSFYYNKRESEMKIYFNFV